MGGRRSRVALKDYTLLRDGLDEEELFGDAEAGRRRKASVWRLFGLAKKEVWVRGLSCSMQSADWQPHLRNGALRPISGEMYSLFLI